MDMQSVDTIDEVMQIVDEKLRAYNVIVKRENNASVVLIVYIVKYLWLHSRTSRATWNNKRKQNS